MLPHSSKWWYLCTLLWLVLPASAQRLLTDDLDTATINAKTLKVISEKYGNLSFSGYLQPQYQISQSKTNPNEYEGGIFAEGVNNRFRLRRGRLRADYVHFNKEQLPQTYFVFQFDGTEQGVNIRDFWGRFYENKWKLLSFTTGVMARPFGYELQLSSSVRESPERGRMSQILMKTERDLGVLVSLNPRDRKDFWRYLQLDLGIYNGQGLSGPREFDNIKDLVTRLSIKPYQPENRAFPLKFSSGISLLYGGIENKNEAWYKTKDTDNGPGMVAESGKKGSRAPRTYMGADIELETVSKHWKSEFRAEIIAGSQSATLLSSATPGEYPMKMGLPEPLYIRRFNGAYFYFIQHLLEKNLIILKYDWYDPNSQVKGSNIKDTEGFTVADIKFSTFGIGFMHIFNSHLKMVAYYSHVVNEKTGIPGYGGDIKDDVFTLRTQFAF